MGQDFSALLARGREMIETRRLSVARDSWGAWYLTIALLNYPLLFLSVAFLAGWMKYLVSFLLALRLFNSVAQITHGCGHQTLFRRAEINRAVGSFTSYLLGYDPQGMWKAHFDHHAYLNTMRDGDQSWWITSDRPAEILKRLLLDLTGWTALCRARQYYRSPRKPRFCVFLAVAGLQTALYGAFFLAGGPYAYFLFYILPLISMYPAQARLRSFVEHHDSRGGPPGGWATRSSEPSLLEKWIFAPAEQGFHLEHHLFPQVPAYRLRSLHRLVRGHPDFPAPAGSYLSSLARFWCGAPAG